MKPTISPITADYAALCTDLSRKAYADVQAAISTTLDLASMAGGPSAVTSIMVHVAGRNISGLATCMAVVRDHERGIAPDRDAALSDDDYLFCCLYLAAGFKHQGSGALIISTAVENFRKLTGRDPDIPQSWTVAVTPDDLAGRT